MTARAKWAEAWRALRTSDENCMNPLLQVAWNLRHAMYDLLAHRHPGSVLRAQMRREPRDYSKCNHVNFFD